jgi:DNA-binding MarR family transcriptional regulator
MMTDNDLNQDDPVDVAALSGTLGFALRRAQAAVARDLTARFAAEGVRPMQFAVLSLLQANPGLRQNQASAALGIQRTNLVPLLDELERRGLAERRRVDGDRRAAAVFITPAGEAIRERLAAAARAHEDRFAARLGGANREVLVGLLSRLADEAFDPPA